MECNTDEYLQICRVCMTDNATKVVLNNQEESFIDVTGIHTYQEVLKDILRLSICVNCEDEFAKCLKFRETAQKTNRALSKLKRLEKLTIHNAIKLSDLLRDNFESTEVSHHKEDVKTFTYDSSNKVKLENFEDELIISLNEDQECLEDIQSKEENMSKKDIIFTSELFTNINEHVSDNEPMNISDITSDDDKPILRKCTKKTKTKAARKHSVDKRKKNNLVRKSTKKNHTSADPNSPSFDLFGYLLKNFTYHPLDAEEQRKKFEERRLDESYCRTKHKCMLCHRGFRLKETFDRHVKLKHVEHPSRPYKCDLCSLHFCSKKRLKQHFQTHSELFKCKHCDFVTEIRNSAKLHILWHEGKTYQCKQCPLSFQRQTSLFNHTRALHPSECVCEECGFSFVGELGLRSHRAQRHAFNDPGKDGTRTEVPEDSRRCIECNITFANEVALDVHRKVSPKHSHAENRLRNDASAKKLTSEPSDGRDNPSESEAKPRRLDPNNVIKRRRGKLRVQSVQCEKIVSMEFARQRRETLTIQNALKCGERQSSFFAYRKHFNSMHPGEQRTLYPPKSSRVLCDHCGKVFLSKAYLQVHMASHTKKTVYNCTDCDKSYYSHVTFMAHRQIHLGVTYPCSVCSKTFNKASNRDRHVAYVHSDVKNVKCDFCDKFFKSSKEQKMHTDHVHYKKPWPKRVRNKDGHRIVDRSERDMHIDD